MKDENISKIVSFMTGFRVAELLNFVELSKLIKSSRFSDYCEEVAEKANKCGDVTQIEGIVFLFIKKGNSNYNGVLEWFSLKIGKKVVFENGKVKTYKNSKIECRSNKEKIPSISNFLKNYSSVSDNSKKISPHQKKTKDKVKLKSIGSEDIMDSRLIYEGCYGMGKRR